MEAEKMKILITGSGGFIARNLIMELGNRGYKDLLLCDRSTTREELDRYVEECGFLIHLAGVNRPQQEEEFYSGNAGFTEELIRIFEAKHKNVPVIYSSTILDTPHVHYGRSKREAERILQEYGKRTGSPIFIFRLPNVFGKWSLPNYNSFVATFCYNVSHGLDIKVNDPGAQITLAYIDDVVNGLISCIEKENGKGEEFPEISETYQTTVGEVAERILAFKKERDCLEIPRIEDSLGKKLYSTYLSYLEPEKFSYKLRMNQDQRGSFTEFLRLKSLGQISVNVAKPGIVKGNHWHHTKVEKFLVVKGLAQIRFRHMITDETAEFVVSGEELEVIDIPVGYTHSIANIGKEDLVTVIWANEVFDPNRPDTYYEEV